MKVLLWCLLALPALGLECQWQKNKFLVTENGKTKSQLVRPGFQYAQYYCGQKVASLYDGSDWVVYANGAFQVEAVSQDYDSSWLSVNESLLALAVGEEFWVFDPDSGFDHTAIKDWRLYRMGVSSELAAIYDGYDIHIFKKGSGFTKTKARERFWYSRVETSDRLVSIYLGDEWLVWDAQSGRWNRKPAQTSYKFAKTLAHQGVAVFVDGKQALGYCAQGERFVTQPGMDALESTLSIALTGIQVSTKTQRWVFSPSACSFQQVP